MPVNLLLILGAPGAIIVSQRLTGPWLVALGASFLLVALGVISRAAAREYESDGLVGLREWRRITTVLAVITIEPVSGGSLVAYTFVVERAYSVGVSGGMLLGLRYDKSLRWHRTARWAKAKEVLESGIEPIA